MGSALVENWRAKMQPVTDIPKNVRIMVALTVVNLLLLGTILVLTIAKGGK